MKGKLFSRSRKEAARFAGAREAGSLDDWRDRCEALQLQLEEMTKRNNERNNYINSVFSSMEDGFFLADTEEGSCFSTRAPRICSISTPLVSSTTAMYRTTCDGEDPVRMRARRRLRHPEDLRGEKWKRRGYTGQHLARAGKYGKKSPIGMLAIVKDITEKKRVENVRKDFVALCPMNSGLPPPSFRVSSRC